MGTWLWYTDEDHDFLDENLSRLLGVKPGAVRRLDDFLAALHEDDRAAVRTAFERSFRDGVWAADAGFDAHLVKPADQNALMELISRKHDSAEMKNSQQSRQ